MHILSVDDERIVLENMRFELKQLFPEDEIHTASTEKDALTLVRDLVKKQEAPVYAFLDIELKEMSGLELAKEIKSISPDTSVIFCTAYKEFAVDAFRIHALGYLLKPVRAKDIADTLDAMQKGWRRKKIIEATPVPTLTPRLRVQTFGNFEAFIGGKPLSFDREKAKELLAYLIDRNGASVTTAEIASVLWENIPYDRSTKNRVTSTVASLKKTLVKAGVGDILVKTWNHLAIDPSKIDCDLYNFLQGDVLAVNSYRGEYMSSYSWAELSNGALFHQAK